MFDGARERAADLGYAAGWSMVKGLPAGLADRAFRGVADVATVRNGAGARQLRKNLRRVVGPGMPETELDELVGAALRSYSRYWLETFRLPKMDAADVAARVDANTTGAEHLDAALARGRGAVLALPHIGNWDVAGMWLVANHGRFATVAERLKPESLFDRFVAYREGLGFEILPLTGGARPPLEVMRERLAENGVVCLLGDRDLSRNGVRVDFFGEPTRMPGGPAVLAATTGAALLPVAKGLGPNSVAKEIKNIRTFMNMANELGYTQNIAHKSKKFGVKGEETDAVYLSDDELRSLFRYNFSDNRRLEAVRDLFVFSSYVGLRYSDASRIKPENIVKIDGEDYIKITSQKTDRPVTIPCNDIVLKIFKKYADNPNRLPPFVSNQKFNQYLKELGEIAGLTQTGRLSSDLNRPLFQCLSSHTARRNFATNCYRAGMDTRMIMAVTGHTTEKSFEKYIKITREETAKRMGEHMKMDLSKKSLRVAG